MDLSAPLASFVAGFPDFIIQLGIALGLFVASLFIYTLMTPHKELALIRAGHPDGAFYEAFFTRAATSDALGGRVSMLAATTARASAPDTRRAAFLAATGR